MPGRLFLGQDPQIAGITFEGPRWNMAPGQDLITLTAEGGRNMRWGIIPVGRVNARGRPVMETIINARSETVFDKSAFAGVKRAVVPVDGWYEWTGKTRRKTAWRITRKDQALIWFAAICDVWAAPGGSEIHQVATVTCAPSADVRDIHHRMGVILEKKDVSTWLGDDEDAARALMLPYRDGGLQVDEAAGVNWNGA